MNRCTFRARYRSWICGLRSSMSGMWPTPSLDAAPQRGQPELKPHGPGWSKARSPLWSRPSRRCRRSPHLQGSAAGYPRWKRTPLRATPRACALRSSGREGCRWAVESPRPLAKRWSARGPSVPACVGPRWARRPAGPAHSGAERDLRCLSANPNRGSCLIAYYYFIHPKGKVLIKELATSRTIVVGVLTKGVEHNERVREAPAGGRRAKRKPLHKA
jgi:hypothetical protein